MHDSGIPMVTCTRLGLCREGTCSAKKWNKNSKSKVQHYYATFAVVQILTYRSVLIACLPVQTFCPRKITHYGRFHQIPMNHHWDDQYIRLSSYRNDATSRLDKTRLFVHQFSTAVSHLGRGAHCQWLHCTVYFCIHACRILVKKRGK